jgi:uncharacterized protein YijF (DUF1287 family)
MAIFHTLLRTMKIATALTGIVLVSVMAGAALLGYRGERSFTDASAALPDVGRVIAGARRLAGTPYDPFMGEHENIGAKAGFIVCSDVPNIAYGLAGFSLQKMLERDFSLHPQAYNSAYGNQPGNPYFHRRARNLYAYFQANGRLLPPGANPAAGDLVFYRGSSDGYISHVSLVTAVDGAGYRVMESAPETVLAQEVPGASPIARGRLLAGFGRMY